METEAAVGNEKGTPPSVPLSCTRKTPEIIFAKNDHGEGILADIITAQQ